jgi:large subunit ribosomal protein L19
MWYSSRAFERYFYLHMNTALAGIQISPVNMENRCEIGIKAGDTVRVHQKIVDEKGKARIQVFEGLVLARKHGSEPGATFTVRKVVDGIGVEKIFPLYSPLIDKIEIVRRSKVRRAKLYYIREKVAREVKRQMRRMHIMNVVSESEAEAAVRAEEEAKRAEEEVAAKQAEEEATAKAEAEAKEAKENIEEKTETDVSAEAAEEKQEEVKEEEKTEEPKKEESVPETQREEKKE